VRVRDRRGDFPGQLGGLARRQGTVLQPLGQAVAFDETHREKVLTFVLADFVDRHDAGMVQACRCLGLGVKALHIVFTG